ncbi:MAG: hypothetical protein IMW89_06005 [Ktedonobacteraceae bacterium]|nr:hypothetical protein [Ktedonobacteraceae bacterium]
MSENHYWVAGNASFFKDHERVVELLDAYSTNELDLHEELVVEQHLLRCAECQRQLKTIRDFHGLFESLTVGVSQSAETSKEHSQYGSLADTILQELVLQQQDTALADAVCSQQSQSEQLYGKSAKRSKWRLRLGSIAAVLVVALLVGSLILTFNFMRTSTVLQRPSIVLTPSTPLSTIRMTSATTGWAIRNGEILRSYDGGTHWQNVSLPGTDALSDSPVRAEPRLTVFLSDTVAWSVSRDKTGQHAYAFHTSDGGKTWQQSSELPDYPGSSVATGQISAVSSQECWIYLTTAKPDLPPALFLHTMDGGQTWQKILSPNLAHFEGNGFAILGGVFLDSSTGWSVGTNPPMSTSRNNKTLLLYVTRDGGQSWQQQQLALPPRLSPFAIFPPVFLTQVDGVLPTTFHRSDDPSHSYVVLYVTHDRGRTWQPTSPLHTSIDYDERLASEEFSFSAQGYWVVTEITRLSSGPDQARTILHVTQDEGRYWQTITPLTDFAVLNNISFVSSQVGWALGNNYVISDGTVLDSSLPREPGILLKTEDGGKTWKQAY